MVAVLHTQADPLERFGLTERQRSMLVLLAEGLSNEEIADRLDCETSTVRNTLANAYRKLGVSDRLKAALFVFRTLRGI